MGVRVWVVVPQTPLQCPARGQALRGTSIRCIAQGLSALLSLEEGTTVQFKMSSRQLSPQGGFSLLEVLISLVLVAFWALGSARMMSATMQLEKSSSLRNVAVALASDLLERIEANQVAASVGAYADANNGTSSSPQCSMTACTGAQLAQFDLSEWKGKLNTQLPSATASIVSGGVGNPFSYTVTITWTDRRSGQTYATSGKSESFAYSASRNFYKQ
jgi:type IV pilus assembly protein PilV